MSIGVYMPLEYTRATAQYTHRIYTEHCTARVSARLILALAKIKVGNRKRRNRDKHSMHGKTSPLRVPRQKREEEGKELENYNTRTN